MHYDWVYCFMRFALQSCKITPIKLAQPLQVWPGCFETRMAKTRLNSHFKEITSSGLAGRKEFQFRLSKEQVKWQVENIYKTLTSEGGNNSKTCTGTNKYGYNINIPLLSFRWKRRLALFHNLLNSWKNREQNSQADVVIRIKIKMCIFEVLIYGRSCYILMHLFLQSNELFSLPGSVRGGVELTNIIFYDEDNF